MFRYIFILLIFINISYAEGKRYFIQLGSFQDQRLLERNINNIPEYLRSHIVVVKSNNWLIPFAYHTPNIRGLRVKLGEYRRYFPDAIISSSSYILKHRVVLNYVNQQSYSSRPPMQRARREYPKASRVRPQQRYSYPQSTPKAPTTYHSEQPIIYHPEAPISYPSEQPIIYHSEAPIVYHPEVTLPEVNEVYSEEQMIAPLLNEELPIYADTTNIQSNSVEEYSLLNRSIDVVENEVIRPTVEAIPLSTSMPIVYTPKKPIEHLSKVTIPRPNVIENPADIKRYHYFTSKMLSGQHYYLAYKGTGGNPNLLIKVKFGTHRVSYQPIIGDMKMADANYIIFNKSLYMYADSFSENGAYSKIESQHRNYILVSSWSGGKKLNTLRYYFRIGDAKRYLNVKQSKDKLSEAIEEGMEYDWGLDL